MYNTSLIDSGIVSYLQHYYKSKAGNFFDFRQSYFNDMDSCKLFHCVLLSDYEDAERVYNYCKGIAGRNLTLKQKRNLFISEIFKPYDLQT